MRNIRAGPNSPMQIEHKRHQGLVQHYFLPSQPWTQTRALVRLKHGNQLFWQIDVDECPGEDGFGDHDKPPHQILHVLAHGEFELRGKLFESGNTEEKYCFEVGNLKLFFHFEMNLPGQAYVGGFNGGGVLLHKGGDDGTTHHLHLLVPRRYQLFDLLDHNSPVNPRVLHRLTLHHDGYYLNKKKCVRESIAKSGDAKR